MYAPPDPRDRTGIEQPTWRSVLAGYLLLAVLLLALWTVSNPLAGTAVLATVVGLSVGARRAAALVRCLRVCREFTVDLGRGVSITVTNAGVDGPN
jgi:hypothetical protein